VPPAPGRPAAEFRIDPARSQLEVLVYRAGPMASFGHNHIVTSRGVEGWARYAGSAPGAAFALELPVASFSVDEAARRQAAGSDFSEPVDAEARRGTLENMRGPAVLDVAAHPVISVRSEALTGTAPHLRATVTMEVAGHLTHQEVPFEVTIGADTLHAHGALELKQSALGLTPFSILLGALRVEDTMRVSFDLTAVRTGARASLRAPAAPSSTTPSPPAP
jgi:hypothetical protein